MFNTTHNNDQLLYNESKEFCVSRNMTLPRTEFKIVGKEYVHRSIFWIADNEESRNAADEKNRANLKVAVTRNSLTKEFCAYLSKSKNIYHVFILKLRIRKL